MKSKKCQKCLTNPATLAAVIDGVYYPNLCPSCRATLTVNNVSSGHARWERGIDLEDHEADIQQPHNADGSPNLRFAQLYPDKARAIFTEDQLRKAHL